jgi:hypothetical protein
VSKWQSLVPGLSLRNVPAFQPVPQSSIRQTLLVRLRMKYTYPWAKEKNQELSVGRNFRSYISSHLADV